MITPLDIENKKFSKRALNGYSTEEVDDFLDELTIAYEKIYKEATESRQTIDKLNNELTKYKQMESTLQSTLLMAQSTAEELKSAAQQQADTIVSDAENAARAEIDKIDARIEAKKQEIADLQRRYEEVKEKLEALLISELELLRGTGTLGQN